MNKDTNVEQALERLLNIKWKFDAKRSRSHCLLMAEYLRRAVLWAQALQVADYWPFFNIAAVVAPNERVSESSINGLKEQMEQWPTSFMVKQTCIFYLQWAYVKDLPSIVRLQLPDPFEPLILLYERGGSFTTEHGFINIGMAGIPVIDWKQYNSPVAKVELNHEALNQIDAQTRKA
jgi:hypothetical protein